MPKKRGSNKREKYYTEEQLIREVGFTKRMILSYLPEPIYKANPGHENRLVVPVWREEDVISALNDKSLRKMILRRREQKKRNLDRKEAEERKLKEYLKMFDIEGMRQKAEYMNRKFVLHVGPTNSGKTYSALEALKKAKCGVYLGPLRLLALEMFDRLNRDGYYCNLLTGEESILYEDADYTASTIELCNFEKEYDVAVIDEAQLMADPTRGDKWTKAIYLVKAQEVHVCLAPEVLHVLTKVLDSFYAPYEVVYHERMTPLVYTGMLKNLSEVRKGDALIVFSRKAVLALSAELSKKNIKASVIYGALPPSSRREEVRRFVSGETEVVIATDAIGMGISIPIKRVVFCAIEKFDGVSRRILKNDEIKQIAGRAGRYGMYDVGEVAALEGGDLVDVALSEEVPPIESITIPFPEEVLSSKYPIPVLFETWKNLPDVPGFLRASMDEANELYKSISPMAKKMDKALVYKLITCPVDVKNERVLYYYVQCVESIYNNDEFPHPNCSLDTLENCEAKHKMLDVRHQMLRRLGTIEDVTKEQEMICQKINEFLKSENKKAFVRKCRICHKNLPATYEYAICQECFQRRRRMW